MLRSRGFSLFEFIRVLSILGVLAAVAVPRYIEMGNSARYAALMSAMAALRQAANNVHVMAHLQNQLGATGQVRMSDGTQVDVIHGWPAATRAGMGSALSTSLGAYAFVQNANGQPRFEVMIINQPYAVNRCYIAYDQAASAGALPQFLNFALDNPLASKGAAGEPQCAP